MPARDTIFALSSGSLPAGIAIVRISGPQAGTALAALVGGLPEARWATLRAVRDAGGELLDRALVLWFPGPDTATGEDLAELHLHGSRAVVAAVSRALAALAGLRPAEPGAFTRRALFNGRLALDQVEGLGELLGAETEAQRRQAMRRAEGGIGRLVDGWRLRLLGLAAHVEAALQFGEEEDDVPPLDAAHRTALASLEAEMAEALARPPAERLRDGVRIVLAGPPNAGKSTLLNAIAGREVAIAAATPGTTRDVIEAPLDLDGIPCILIDTAGLREAEDAVERIGIDRAHIALAGADLILWLGPPEERPPEGVVIVVQSAADLPGRGVRRPGADLLVSARTGQGLDVLRARIVDGVRNLLPPLDHVALSLRQRDTISDVLAAVRQGQSQADGVLVAELLREALVALDRLTGRAGVEDMLDHLFDAFCIGK